MAEELYSDASELIRAARMPQITTPLSPTGSKVLTSIGKARSGLAKVPSACTPRAEASICPVWESGVLVRAKAIIPGIRNRNTGRSFK